MTEVTPRWPERNIKPTTITTNHSNVACLEKQERKGSKSSFKVLSIDAVNRLEMG
ncbi:MULTISPECIES: hypothetical protein [Paenibacillus]|uniref:hypothetical protein n=1 Tax=Paenibacillus TaxID=44249 RepID=UPI00037C612D|nr:MULTISPECIES: hypothetical protein [Paenibacillus]UMR36661.1 hypothetical protein MJ749_04320 [Paenibacillus polymyxa]